MILKKKKTLRNWKNDILVQNDRQQVDVWVRGSVVFVIGINQQALATHSAQKASALQMWCFQSWSSYLEDVNNEGRGSVQGALVHHLFPSSLTR